MSFFSGWKVLVNKMYHGKMSDQTIRTSMPLVQELSGRRKVSQNTQHSLSLQKENKDEMNRERHQRLLTPVNTKKIEAKDNRMKPKFIIKKFFGKTQQLTGIRAEVKLPGVVSYYYASLSSGDAHCNRQQLLIF